MTSQRNPMHDCIDVRCPFVDWPHTVELVGDTDVRVHYTIDPERRVITVLWIHSDAEPWPDDAERQAILARHNEEHSDGG